MWQCRCGWSGDEPDGIKSFRPLGLEPQGFVYKAPCCPKCGRYFSAEEIDAAQTVKPATTRIKMGKFEETVLERLADIPKGHWQRHDGLMCEPAILAMYPVPFAGLRLWLMEKRGLIRSTRLSRLYRMKSYQLRSTSINPPYR